MIFIKNGIKEKISKWNDKDFYILTDFDRTITSGDSNSSWGILSGNNFNEEYEKERKKLHNYYRPLEIDSNISFEEKNKLMEEWWIKHINLLIKYKISEDIVKNALNDNNLMKFRKGAKDFLKNMYERNIPVIIISAGIGNFIEQFLIKNNCYYKNIYIISNFIKFENNIAVGIKGNIIHSFNKNEISITKEIKEVIKNKTYNIVFGDTIGDSFMSNEKSLKIGFLDEKIEENLNDYKNNFNIVCTNNTSYEDLFNELKK